MEESKKECLCLEYSKTGETEKIFSIMKNIGGTNPKDGIVCGDIETTNLLKCKACNRLYLWNQYSGEYCDKIFISEYKGKIKQEELEIILKNSTGILREI